MIRRRCLPLLLCLQGALAVKDARSHNDNAYAQEVDVIIIGAGWAGMAAADAIERANQAHGEDDALSFVILESTNRTGGRSHAITFGRSSQGWVKFGFWFCQCLMRCV